MRAIDLSILIPARNEMFLARTVQDILEHSEMNTEIIAVLDGCWADPPVQQHERVTLLRFPESIGQRAATNAAARIAKGKYVMKVDAHCAFDQGFDRKMLEVMEDDITMAPLMRNLHAFDWVCPNGHRRYQGPSGACTECGQPTVRDVVWIAKESPQSTAYRFDKTLHFQYWQELKKRQVGDLVETMSLQGSCFLMTREKYWSLNICDESWGSWGQQGVEVAVKTWLSGGRVLVNRKTWYAHMFRTQGGDFGFPYPISGSQVDRARKVSREILQANKYPQAIHPFEWLLDKFYPVPDWHAPKERAIVYYTCNTHLPEIDERCREQLKKAGLPIISVSLNKEIDFGDERIVMVGERSPETMHRQILKGLETARAEIVFLCESDVLYHPSHFDFTPERKDVFYFNTNVWKARYPDGHAVWTDDLQQLSGMAAYRPLVHEFFRQRVEQIEREGFNRHYEPGPKQTVMPVENNGKHGLENWQSKVCNVCIRHDQNITKSKWSVEEFRDPKYAKGWREADEVPGWGRIDESYFKPVQEDEL
jgi:hypothetical protein